MSETSHLSMLDESGAKRRIIPAEVSGRFRRYRNQVHFILMLIFLVTPWVRINGTQAIQLDIPGRHFEIFGLVFLSHDSPLIFFAITMIALSIMLTTALWGRVWCGWACPQTVFIESIYRRIEILIEGDYLSRRKLYSSPMNREKFFKYSLKWFSFFVFSSIFAHSLIAYFAGSEQLIEMMNRPPAQNWSYFLIVSGITALLLFNFGWFREQFCIIMCPYGRFQGVLMDPQSLTIAYNQKRGEPRKSASVEKKDQGDCVACNRCVQVCPTGIDIRNGQQMECIGCTACIDACDEIMTKVNKPVGLISYDANVPRSQVKLLRPRVLAYLVLFLLSSSGLAYNVAFRKDYAITALRATDTPYQLTQDEKIINHFRIRLHNQSHKKQIFEVSLPRDEGQWEDIILTQPHQSHELPPGGSGEIHVFLTFEMDQLDDSGTTIIPLVVRELESRKDNRIEVKGVGPIKN